MSNVTPMLLRSSSESSESILSKFCTKQGLQSKSKLASEKVRNGSASVKGESTSVFRVFRGVIILPFRNYLHPSIISNYDRSVSFQEGVWVGPESIIRYRCLHGSTERQRTFSKSNHLMFELSSYRLFRKKGRRIEVIDTSHGGPYKGGSQIQQQLDYFVVKNSEGKPSAKCFVDRINKRCLICGSNPLFSSDKPKDAIGSTSFFPWLQVSLDEDDISVDLWSGYTYIPLWYAEMIRMRCGTMRVFSADDDKQVCDISSTNNRWEVKSSPEIDPTIFLCLGCIMMIFHNLRYSSKIDDVIKRSRSQIFKVVNGEVLSPFQSTYPLDSHTVDNSDDEDKETNFINSHIHCGVWVGPEDVIKNKFLSKYKIADVQEIQPTRFKLEVSRLKYWPTYFEDEEKISIMRFGLHTSICSNIHFNKNDFILFDSQEQICAKCMEDMTNRTCLVCGTSKLFTMDDPFETCNGIDFYPWLKVQLENNDLTIDMWTGYSFTPLWFSKVILIEGVLSEVIVMSVESEIEVGRIIYYPECEFTCLPNVDPDLFVCVSSIMGRLKLSEWNTDATKFSTLTDLRYFV